MNERIQKLTTSQVKCFKSCRRRYFLEYVQNLKPVETPKALEIGSLYHAGIEMILTGHKYPDVEVELVERAIADAAKKEIDYEPLNVFVALEMVRAWDRDSGWREWQILAVEKSFEVSTGYAKRLLGKLDGIVIRPETGKPYIMEHKSTSNWGDDGISYLDALLLDEQATNYLYAYSKMLEDGTISGAEVDGTFYDIIEKPKLRPYTATPVEQRKYTKDGRLYASQHEDDETPEDFRIRVREWYAEKPRVHTAFVYRTGAMIAEAVEDFNAQVRDLNAAERDFTWYRNPEACKILPCPYRAKCLEDNPSTDCLFVKKEKTNEEL